MVCTVISPEVPATVRSGAQRLGEDIRESSRGGSQTPSPHLPIRPRPPGRLIEARKFFAHFLRADSRCPSARRRAKRFVDLAPFLIPAGLRYPLRL